MVTLQTFSQQWRPRFGRSNPERMDLEFWVEMVRSGESAWTARQRIDPKGALGSYDYTSPAWCFHRMGGTRTRLPDGSVVCVAGEHEDHYDPDFFIYNDVVVFRPADELEIYGYPPHVFPPTDFHTTTLVGDTLWLIGSLGYTQVDTDRTRTQVFALDTRKYRMERVPTRGDDPGWLSRHRARLSMDSGRICVWGGERLVEKELVANTEMFEFDVGTRRWHHIGKVPEDTDAAEVLSRFPDRLEPMDENQASLGADVLRATTPPGHPLFAVDVWPIAEDRTTLAHLVRLEDGTGRFALCDIPFSETRPQLPEPKTLLFRDLTQALGVLPTIKWKRWREIR